MDHPPPKPSSAIRFSKSKHAWRYTTGGSSGFRAPYPSALVIVSWNVDRSSRFPYQRLSFLLAYIRFALEKCRAESSITRETEHTPPPCCILLQEVHREAFALILADNWVREYFQVIPGSVNEWASEDVMYGNVTMISRSVPASNARLMVFKDSTMGRTAVLVDVHLNVPAKPDRTGKGKGKERVASVTARIANAHLESRPEGIISRTNQLAAIAEELKDNTIDGGIVGGDMNAVRVEDGALPGIYGLTDAWTGGDGDEQGFTWGYQPAKSKTRPGRLEKILYWQYRHRFVVEEPRILGIGLKMRQGGYASDHYGLLSLIRFRE